MAHPVAASRALDFFLDLGNLTKSVGGNVVKPPNNEEYWKAKGAGVWTGWEWTIYKASETEVGEGATAAGEIYWDSVTLGLENGPEPLFGFKVSVRGYQDTIVETPPPTDEDGNPIGEPTYSNTRIYPETAVESCKVTNPQKRVPSLWPGRDNAISQEWANTIFENQAIQYSTVIAARSFEGVALYNCDQPSTNEGNPAILGITEGEARCVGFIENKDVLDVNFMPPGDYYVVADSMTGYIRTPDNKIEPLVNTNLGLDGRLVPVELAGRITFPEELPRSTPQNPIAIGTTYLQQEGWQESFAIPFPGFIGRHLWAYTGVETADFEGNRIKDRFGNDIEDFRWVRSIRPEKVSGYNYVLVFDEALFEYIERRGGPFTPEIFVKNPAATGEWFPSEPYDPDATPGIYPIDTIPSFVPDPRETVDVEYTFTISGGLPEESITVKQTCIAPTRNWAKMLKALLERSYYYNGIERSYATVPGYCDPNSPNFGDNQQDPYCVETGQS